MYDDRICMEFVLSHHILALSALFEAFFSLSAFLLADF